MVELTELSEGPDWLRAEFHSFERKASFPVRLSRQAFRQGATLWVLGLLIARARFH